MKNIKYIIEKKEDFLWGVSVTNVGYENIQKNQPYPTKDHLLEYSFNIKHGRTLNEYQMVYILNGSGLFCSKHAGEHKVHAGEIFFLFPDEWHTYYPLSETGWSVFWIGFRGKDIDNKVKNGFLNVDFPIFKVGFNDEVVRIMKMAIDIANDEKPYFQQMLAGIVNYLLGFIYYSDKNNSLNIDKKDFTLISKARMMMYDRIGDDFKIEDLAKELNISYSFFRKHFKLYTGLSPLNYFLEIKLQTAKRLLRYSDFSIKEISWKLNFTSSASFCIFFKKKTGVTPVEYRNYCSFEL